MENFQWKNSTRIIFGKHTHEETGRQVRKYSKNILLHYEGDGSLIKKLGIYDKVIFSLKQEGIAFHELGDVVPNPRLNVVRKGISLCKEKGIDFILAIGGGSVIDSAKAIALGISYEGNVWDFFTGKNSPKASVPIGVVLTIPGAGSEMSESAIITDEKNVRKCVCDSEYNFPEFSILNPEVCYTVPKHLIAAGIADILSHLMERYFSQSNNVELSNRLLEATMKTVVEFGTLFLKDRNNYSYASEIMWAATVAHNGMIACGRTADWASHRIEYELSASYDLTHGAGMALIFPAWIQYTKNSKPELFERFFREIFGESDFEKGLKKLKQYFQGLGLKLSLSEYGIGTENFEIMAERALDGAKTLGRFQKLKKEDIVNILYLAK
ncbi:iron-containing alcohol dehydrogenase [Fusobacterium necrophorum]|uniref:iron-containing alcohol dehydrogenase n=1 Tax=Fusobacterium necrophorum TaxID=859 RepID=UPI00254B91DD|nr:iron-containing alcohol dehydrogenase [Fusobacterium necrophorum]MDK4524652.1 iron-containing alcohol dehydrogenase [Fusobacterium necrophorum]